jgi:hypothetical protein
LSIPFASFEKYIPNRLLGSDFFRFLLNFAVVGHASQRDICHNSHAGKRDLLLGRCKDRDYYYTSAQVAEKYGLSKANVGVITKKHHITKVKRTNNHVFQEQPSYSAMIYKLR